MTILQSSQVQMASGLTLEQELTNKLDLADFVGSLQAGSTTLPNGDIIKRGDIPASASIGANSVLQVTVTFAQEFPTACVFFHAILTPATTTDFYGMVSIVSLSKTQAVIAVKNGATAQAIASGKYIAAGY